MSEHEEQQTRRWNWDQVRPESSNLLDRVHLQGLIPQDTEQPVLVDMVEYDGPGEGQRIGYRLYLSRYSYPRIPLAEVADEVVEGCPDCGRDAVADNEQGQPYCTDCGWRE